MKNRVSYRQSGKFRLMTKEKSQYYTFIPKPLSVDLEIELDAELTALLSTANRLLGQLEGMSSLLPNAEAIELIFLRKEALLSCQIDGITAPFYDIIDTSKKEGQKNHSISAYISAMKYGKESRLCVCRLFKLLCW